MKTPFAGCPPRRVLLLVFALLVCGSPAPAAEPVPDKLVVLTFDDSVASQHRIVRPLLKHYGFGATFFITEGFSFRTNKKDYLTWEQIAELHRDGFEIGNHTRDHLGVSADTLGLLPQQIEAINTRCAEHGIPRPVSFAYPGNAIHTNALAILRQLGIKFARRGGAPEFPYEAGRGFAFEPGVDHPLLIPSAGDARPNWSLADFQRAARQARGGKIAVLQFHGVPDNEHPWVNTPPALFEQYMNYLHRNGYRVVALRDLARFVDSNATPPVPLAVVEKRKSAPAARTLRGRVVDIQTQQPLACRLYLQDAHGRWFFPDSATTNGAAVTYQRRSGFNTNAVEMHTTLSAHPFEVDLPPGRYTVTVERGKEYFPETREITVGDAPLEITLPLRRWINLSERGWFSGDTHAHRDPAELPVNMFAEDVNVVFPMVYWTTVDDVPPSQSPRNFKGSFSAEPVAVAAAHVFHPRNTEYEIFTTAKKPHTLGALLIVNHRGVFDLPALPIRKVAERARAEGALLDLEKHNWPWSMSLVPLVKPDLFELANNHHWRVEFGVRNWALPAPEWMEAGTGIATEREWTLYGFRTYYALLNCGFRIAPAAGTANGVHPVPLGFSRVYVHLPQGFNYDAWVDGLKRGRSFVTTGPMLLAAADGEDPGHTFQAGANGSARLRLKGEMIAPSSKCKIELITNGELIRTLTATRQQTEAGAFAFSFDESIDLSASGWVALRAWEELEGGRFRFAHTAPWFVQMEGKPQRPRRQEAAWLVQRVEEEIARNRAVLPASALEEFEQARAAYEEILRRAE